MPRTKISRQINLELSNRELLAIGRIVAHWGSLEYKVFYQTMEALVAAGSDHVPKEMNNIQFTRVLKLWKTHVIDGAKGRKKTKLSKVYDRICQCYDYRQALVHGMWDWDTSAPDKITATRIRKKQIIKTHFTASDLEDFATVLGEINFDIDYPGGWSELASKGAKQGSYISRLGLAMFTEMQLFRGCVRPGSV